MAKCPSCGADNQSLVKSWSMIGKPSKSGEMFKLTIGLYDCHSCGKSFRCAEDKEKISMKGVLDRNSLLEEKLMEATKKRSELEERVQALKNEKVCLITEIEALKVIPVLEEKVSSLESDVKKLREEKGSLLSLVKELRAVEVLAPKENPLEAYLVAPVLRDQSPVVETSLPEQAALDLAVEATSENDAEVVVTGVPCEVTQPEVPVVEECSCECINAEPIDSSGEAVEASPLETTIVEKSSETPLDEPELPSISESASMEPIIVDSPVEVSVIGEVATQVPEAVAPIETVAIQKISTLVKPEEVQYSEIGTAEEKPVNGSQVVAEGDDVPVREGVPPEMKVKEERGVENTPSEVSNVETPPTIPTPDITPGVETPTDSLVESASSVTQVVSEKFEAQPDEIKVAAIVSDTLTTEEVVAIVSVKDLVADSNVVQGGDNPAYDPAPVQEESISAAVIEVVPIVASSEILIPEHVNVETASGVKLEEEPIFDEKSG